MQIQLSVELNRMAKIEPERIGPLWLHCVECTYWPVLHTLHVGA
jgi:hypothetical protein